MKTGKKNKEIIFEVRDGKPKKIRKTILKSLFGMLEEWREQELKSILGSTFSTPNPKKKAEFIRNAELPRLSTLGFMLQQIVYIRKMTWLFSFFISVCAFLCADSIGRDSIWIISSMMPLLAVCSITESARTKIYGMAELEQASRFSLKSVVLARMGIMSFFHLIIFAVMGTWRLVSIYLFVPYLLTSVLCLMAVRKMQGKEINYVCMGIAVGIGFLNLILKANIPALYGEKTVVWWCVSGVFLGEILWKESRKMAEQMEAFV